MPTLPSHPTLKDVQAYVAALEEERGFTDQTAAQKGLLLGEEIGELFKAMRKHEAELRADPSSNTHDLDEECADVFIYLCAVANRYDIDLESAFREKEEKNKARTWE